MSSSITDSQSNPNYYLLPSGFGCSCPEENSSRINSRDECLSAAQSLLLNGAAGALFEDTIENYTIPDDVMAAPKKWKFSPCGCFIWKNGRRIIYMDEHENDDVICTAVRWAQLVCKDARVSEDAERELSIVGSSFQGSGDHLAGVVNLTDVQSIGVGENIRKEECFDWEGFQPIYLWKNRNYCITVEDASHNSKEIFMKRCDSQVFDEHWFHYDRILYFHIQYRYQDDSTCLTGGRSNSLEPSLFLSNCTSTTGATTLAQQWTYDSNGRFRNRMNGKYLAVSGCDIFNDGRLVTKVLSDINAHCDFTQWLSYTKINDIGSGSWAAVYGIYGPLLLAIICIIITGVDQCKKREELEIRHRPFRRVRRTRGTTPLVLTTQAHLPQAPLDSEI